MRVLIESPPFVEIGGLIVDQASLGEGIGRRLVDACEEWAAQLGIGKIRVRTNQNRSEALQFYTRIGFISTKSQHVLDKPI